MLLKRIQNFVDRHSPDNISVEVEFPMPLHELLKDVSDLDRDCFRAIVSGKPVDDWDYVPSPSDDVIFVRKVRGAATPALLAIGSALKAFWAAYGGYIIAALVAAAAGFTVSKLFGPKTPDGPGDGFENSQTYGWDGIKNIVGDGSTVPVVYGRHRVGGVVMEAHIDGDEEATASEEQYLNVMLGLSEGEIEEIETDTIRLGKTNIANFSGGTPLNELIPHNNALPYDTWVDLAVSNSEVSDLDLNIQYYATFGEYRERTTGGDGYDPSTDILHYYWIKNQIVVEMAPLASSTWKEVWRQDIQLSDGSVSHPSWGKTTTEVVRLSKTYLAVDNLAEYKYRVKRVLIDKNHPYVDECTFVSARESGNLTNVFVETRLGTASQKPMKNFSKINRHFNIRNNVQLVYNSPYVYTTDDIVDAAKLVISLPALFNTHEETGAMQPASVSFDVSYRAVGDSTWLGAKTYTVTESSKSEVHLIIPVYFPGRDQYEVRVLRTTEDSTSLRLNNDSYLKSVTETENGLIGYINTALLGLRILATDTLSGSMPEITVIVKGRRLLDFRDNSYGWSRNPALILYDLMTNRRYGLGNKIRPEQLNMDSFTEFADWCDEIVQYEDKDVITGQVTTKSQKRYEMDIVLDTPHKAAEIIRKILSTCRAEMYHVGSQFEIVVEQPLTYPVQTFNMGNIRAGSYEESFISFDAIPTQIKGQAWLEDNDYESETVICVDKTRLDEPVESRDLQLIGLTHMARVKRELLFAIKKLKAIRRTVTFDALIEGIIARPGKLIAFQHDTPQNGYGGRVKAVDASTVYLNRPIPVTNGQNYTFVVKRQSDQSYFVHSFTWTGATGQISQISCTPTGVQYFDLWTFGNFTPEAGLHDVMKTARPLKVKSVTLRDDQYVTIEAEDYTAQVFNEDENIDIIPPKYSMLGTVVEYEHDGNSSTGDPTYPPGINPEIGYVENVALERIVRVQGSGVAYDLSVMFSKHTLPVGSPYQLSHYEILYTTEYGCAPDRWKSAGTTLDNKWTIPNVEVGLTYYVAIRVVVMGGLTNRILSSPEAWVHSLLIEAKTPPLAPINLQVAGGAFENRLTWDNAEIYAYVEVWCTTGENDRSNAVKIATVGKGSDRYTHTGLNFNVIYYYWIIAYDELGFPSAWCPDSETGGIPASPSSDPALIKDMLDGEIEESMLVQALQDKINDGGGLQSKVELLANQWTVKIQEDEYITGMGLALYEDWDAARAYVVGDYVWGPDSKVYKCILGNTNQQPPNGTYWDEIENGAKSEMIILSDKFAVVKPDGSGGIKVPFIVGTVGGINDVIGIDGTLVVDGSITATKIATGSLIVGNLSTALQELTLNANQQWSEVSGPGKPMDYADVTLEQIGGSGINIVPARYSIFNDPLGLPPIAKDYCTLSQETTFGYFGDRCLKMVATTSEAWMQFRDAFSYNVRITPNKKWIVSCYVRVSSTTGYLQFYLNTPSNGYMQTFDVPTANQWVRASVTFDLSADANTGCVLRMDLQSSAGTSLWVDGFMMEQQVGQLSTPSAYSIPAAATVGELGYTGAMDATKNHVFAQDNAPTSGMVTGDLWFDTNNTNKLYRYNGSAWSSVRDTGIDDALLNIANLEIELDGKITSFYQASAPTVGMMKDGDLWYDTDDFNKPYRYRASGTAVVEQTKIIDNGQTGTSWSGTWVTSGLSGYYGTDSLYCSAGNTGWYKWLFSTSGVIEVYVWYTQGTGRSTQVEYEVYDNTTLLDTIYINQRKNGSQWVKLGTYTFASKPTVVVYQDPSQDGAVGADAVKFYRAAVPASGWIPLADGGVQEALDLATSAIGKADGKVETYFSATEPAAPKEGDLWYDTVSKILKRWDSSGGGWDTSGTDDSAWRHSSDVTRIDGGKIYTNTITASAINGTNFGNLTITSGKIIIDANNGLEIKRASGLKLYNGGDIRLYESAGYDHPVIMFYNQVGQGTLILETSSYGISPSYARFTRNGFTNEFHFGFAGGHFADIRMFASKLHTGHHVAYSTAYSLGDTTYHWNYVYAAHALTIADFYWMDERVDENGAVVPVDDIEVIKSIKPSSSIDRKTGLRLINDSTLPTWLVHKHHEDGEDLNEKGERVRSWKAGDIAVNADGKPFLSTTTMISLLMGAIRQLDDKINALQ